jgi:hypothetical protein
MADVSNLLLIDYHEPNSTPLRFCHPGSDWGVAPVHAGGESPLFNYKIKIKISLSKTITILGGMITYIEYTFIVTDEI